MCMRADIYIYILMHTEHIISSDWADACKICRVDCGQGDLFTLAQRIQIMEKTNDWIKVLVIKDNKGLQLYCVVCMEFEEKCIHIIWNLDFSYII